MTNKTGAVRLFAMAIGCLTVAACGQRHAAEQAVRNILKDPDSAKFGEFYYNKTTEKACLDVNSKNSMGGFTGSSPMELRRDKDGWHYAAELTDFSFKDCREMFADKAN